MCRYLPFPHARLFCFVFYVSLLFGLLFSTFLFEALQASSIQFNSLFLTFVRRILLSSLLWPTYCLFLYFFHFNYLVLALFPHIWRLFFSFFKLEMQSKFFVNSGSFMKNYMFLYQKWSKKCTIIIELFVILTVLWQKNDKINYMCSVIISLIILLIVDSNGLLKCKWYHSPEIIEWFE